MENAIRSTGVVRYEDFEGFLRDLFSTWVGGGERAWVRFAWSVLERDGMTAYEDEAGRNLVVVRLLALSALGREFYAQAFEEGESYVEYQESASWAIVGVPGGIDVEWLIATTGATFERVDAQEDDGGYTVEDGVELLLPYLLRFEAWAVASCLRKHLGDAEVFASLYASAGEARYPLSTEQIRDAVGSAEPLRLRAYSWISEGMPL